MCRDAPVRQCFAWHVVPRGRKVRHAKRDDGTDDPYSVRMLCPAHNDRGPSLSISVDDGRVKWQCFACGKDATAKVRLALIREYGIEPGCLPMPAKEREDILDCITAIVAGDCDYAEKVLRVAAAIEGYRDLPRGGELERIAALAGVARRSAYRARKATAGLQAANTRSYPPAEIPVKRRRS